MAPRNSTAAAKRKAASASPERAPSDTSAARPVEESLAILAGGPIPLSDRQKEIVDAEEATSEITPGGVVEADPRMESEGVKSPIKADLDNPESPVMYDPKGTLASPEQPGDVTVGVGETPAQHEAHVQMSGAAVIAERLEKEEGPDGLPTEMVAREQHERAARLEFQRVSGDQPAERIGEGADNPNKTGDPAAKDDDSK